MKTIGFIALGLLALSAAPLRGADARENWNKDCMQCHGQSGAADTKMGKKLNAKDLTDATVQASFTDADAAWKDWLHVLWVARAEDRIRGQITSPATAPTTEDIAS